MSRQYKMQSGIKYACDFCSIKKRTKDALTRHTALCKFIHTSAKERCINEDSQEPLPSQHVLLQYIMDLTEKCDRLEQKLDKIQKTCYQQKRKNFGDFIETLSYTGISFAEWLKSLIVTDEDLEILFKNDLRECIKSILLSSTIKSQIPFKAFAQRQHGLYVYTNSEDIPDLYKWRLMSIDEFKRIVLIISQRVMRKFTEWQIKNKDDIEINEQLRELQNLYMHKANGGNRTLESNTIDIKKYFISNIQVSLKNVDG